ncbi:MAG: hypothetical protein K0R78_1903 [Pelosinus sp.]|jgi:uncharacterized protein (DUF2164 family)|nr:hypothetical protein [Pelosinus sp.]
MTTFHLSKELKKQAVDDIKKYFLDNREEEMGQLASELLLDFMIEKVGKVLYNQGIKDAHTFMSEKVEELYVLKKKQR